MCQLTFALWRVVEGAKRRRANVAHQRVVRPHGHHTHGWLIRSWNSSTHLSQIRTPERLSMLFVVSVGRLPQNEQCRSQSLGGEFDSVDSNMREMSVASSAQRTASSDAVRPYRLEHLRPRRYQAIPLQRRGRLAA